MTQRSTLNCCFTHKPKWSKMKLKLFVQCYLLALWAKRCRRHAWTVQESKHLCMKSSPVCRMCITSSHWTSYWKQGFSALLALNKFNYCNRSRMEQTWLFRHSYDIVRLFNDGYSRLCVNGSKTSNKSCDHFAVQTAKFKGTWISKIVCERNSTRMWTNFLRWEKQIFEMFVSRCKVYKV